MRVSEAVYHKTILIEHSGNPLIEALPEKPDDNELYDYLCYYPAHDNSERLLSAYERVEYLARLKDLRQPLPVHMECFRAIDTAIRHSYSSKNPASPTGEHFRYFGGKDVMTPEPVTGLFVPKGTGLTVIGESGVGKSCMLEKILEFFDDTILHKRYKNQAMPVTQVVWIKVDCPSDASIRGLCLAILRELDRKLECGETRPASTIDTLLDQIESRIRFCYLGFMVIDEMQYLNVAKSGGSDHMVGFIHNLVNKLGIPILFCANPPFDDFLRKSFRTARRAEASGYFTVEMLEKNECWDFFVSELWRLQWTDVITPLTSELSDRLFHLSVGNLDLAVRIYSETQRLLIGSGDERITLCALDSGAASAIRATRKLVEVRQDELRFLKALSENKKKRISTEFDETVRSTAVVEKSFVVIPGDLSRCPHPEFQKRVIELRDCSNLYGIMSDPGLIVRASEGHNPLLDLTEAGILCVDPLAAFM